MNANEIAAVWIRYTKDAGTDEFPVGDAVCDFFDLPREMPELCWQTILAILERIEPDPDDSLFQALAAGLVEDLLVNHGPAIIAQVEQQAQLDTRFNLLLGGVWPSTIAADVWARLEACRREVW